MHTLRILHLPRMVFVVALGLGLGSSGCTGLASLADTLNTRQVTSCLWYQGAAGPYAHVTGVTATGGAKLELCVETRKP